MRIPGRKAAKAFYRWLRSRVNGKALILGYHRVVNYENDPYNLCVTPQHFAEQLERIAQVAQPITLERLVKGILEDNIPDRAVVVTIDDGYADTLYHASSLLDQYQIPATVFITTGFQGKLFWWDELLKIFIVPKLPSKKDFLLPASTLDWINRGETTNREQLFWEIYNHLLPLPGEERGLFIEQFNQGFGDVSESNSLRRPLTVAELIELSKNELISIGGHTVTHPLLSRLSNEQQMFEISQCKFTLEKIVTGQQITTFSYPNGSYSDLTLSIVKENGFNCACASEQDVIHRNSNLFNLPRFWIPDWSGEKFNSWLLRWLPA